MPTVRRKTRSVLSRQDVSGGPAVERMGTALLALPPERKIATLNRTFLSKLVAIKILQEWKSTAFVPPQLHAWRMFIRPDELKGLLLQAGFEFRSFKVRRQT